VVSVGRGPAARGLPTTRRGWVRARGASSAKLTRGPTPRATARRPLPRRPFSGAATSGRARRPRWAASGGPRPGPGRGAILGRTHTPQANAPLGERTQGRGRGTARAQPGRGLARHFAASQPTFVRRWARWTRGGPLARQAFRPRSGAQAGGLFSTEVLVGPVGPAGRPPSWTAIPLAERARDPCLGGEAPAPRPRLKMSGFWPGRSPPAPGPAPGNMNPGEPVTQPSATRAARRSTVLIFRPPGGAGRLPKSITPLAHPGTAVRFGGAFQVRSCKPRPRGGGMALRALGPDPPPKAPPAGSARASAAIGPSPVTQPRPASGTGHVRPWPATASRAFSTSAFQHQVAVKRGRLTLADPRRPPHWANRTRNSGIRGPGSRADHHSPPFHRDDRSLPPRGTGPRYTLMSPLPPAGRCPTRPAGTGPIPPWIPLGAKPPDPRHTGPP